MAVSRGENPWRALEMEMPERISTSVLKPCD
jgi:hypothetical protein